MSKYKKFSVNKNGRDFLCSDIHGHFELLEKKLIDVDFNEEIDRVFSLGDLIDRGPNSKGALEAINKPWFHAVMGNHEAMACKALFSKLEDYGATYHWVANGGQWIFDEDDKARFLLNEAFAFLPLVIEVELKGGKRIGLIHAEMPGISWGELVEKVKEYPSAACDGDNLFALLVWARTKIEHMLSHEVDGIDHIYHGHSIVNKPVTLGNCTYMDMGSFHTGKIGFIELK